MGDEADDFTRCSVLSIIKSNCGSFFEKGILRLGLDVEFYIDTGYSPLACCR